MTLARKFAILGLCVGWLLMQPTPVRAHVPTDGSCMWTITYGDGIDPDLQEAENEAYDDCVGGDDCWYWCGLHATNFSQCEEAFFAAAGSEWPSDCILYNVQQIGQQYWVEMQGTCDCTCSEDTCPPGYEG